MSEFDYDLPADAVAQVPAEPRDGARLLDATVSTPAGAVAHRTVRDLPGLLGPGDVVVVNDSAVRPSRLRLRKPSGGAVEVVLLEPLGPPGRWEALVRPGRRVPAGTRLAAPGPGGAPLELVEVGERRAHGTRAVRLLGDPAPHATMALPPYITAAPADPGRYQTVYARRPGSVAAPTAGLHLSHAVLDACRDRGAEVHAVELAVGLATFRPVEAERTEDHVMHAERYEVPAATWEACRRARRVVAVGTTTVRALETVAATGRLDGRTELFIHGDHPFGVVDVLLTNFHLPRSSLLVLLDAFCGPRWRALYALALAEGYRFLSFGDAMLVPRGR